MVFIIIMATFWLERPCNMVAAFAHPPARDEGHVCLLTLYVCCRLLSGVVRCRGNEERMGRGWTIGQCLKSRGFSFLSKNKQE